MRSLDKGLIVGALFLDLKKAFDTVNHILMAEMSKYNISKWSLIWFDSYFKNYEQSVVIINIKSFSHKIETVILGPILFSIYINDLPEICLDVRLQMYAVCLFAWLKLCGGWKKC